MGFEPVWIIRDVPLTVLIPVTNLCRPLEIKWLHIPGSGSRTCPWNCYCLSYTNTALLWPHGCSASVICIHVHISCPRKQKRKTVATLSTDPQLQQMHRNCIKCHHNQDEDQCLHPSMSIPMRSYCSSLVSCTLKPWQPVVLLQT